ncbi:hypothetical protein SAMN05660772_01847 [Pasteurella testudinis DSM 23072]|uniref:Uncharacterized protein n=1 Tax=Pasteurella testudinis DSM 23072 TaxID=1122938 RepID=A0A1W1UK23_9PAST|nr:hypothetical protein [Pasteurella testudinis]SMB81430.1 hypothetical protein SAMN05660772_01847 [Pasteurella testudinis DSM 23072]SUB51405.1 Uncharacterised protein [Pasteurella testudinis]
MTNSIVKSNVSVVNTNVMAFVHDWALKSTRFEAVMPEKVDFANVDFQRWCAFALEAAYLNRTGKTDCPYAQCKSALRRIGGAAVRNAFNEALGHDLKNEEVLKHIVEGTVPETLQDAVDAGRAAWEVVDLAYAKFSTLLFSGFALNVPSMDIQLLPAFGTTEGPKVQVQEDFNIDDVDVAQVLAPLGWKIFREDGAKRLIHALGLSADTTPMAAWFKGLSRLAVLSAAFGDEETVTVDIGGANRTIHSRGWNTGRMNWLRNAVYADNAYAGDPRDYAGQLAQLEEEEATMATLESVYEQYQDVLNVLCTQMKPREGEPKLDPNSFRVFTIAGLWKDEFITADGTVICSATADTLENAMKLVSEARVYSMKLYAVNREKEEMARKLHVIKQLGW